MIPRYRSFRSTSNSRLRHFSRGNFSSANVVTSDVTSLNYVTDVIIKGREIKKLTIKYLKFSNTIKTHEKHRKIFRTICVKNRVMYLSLSLYIYIYIYIYIYACFHQFNNNQNKIIYSHTFTVCRTTPWNNYKSNNIAYE